MNGSHRTKHFDVSKTEDLIRLVKTGLIWGTPYEQKGIDAITSGLVKVEECQNLPADIADLVRSK